MKPHFDLGEVSDQPRMVRTKHGTETTMNTPSVEERLRRARGFSALIARTASQAQVMSDSVPSPAFWSGLAQLASDVEDDIAAVAKALDVEAQERSAPDVFVEK
jgi:hypothetical protein